MRFRVLRVSRVPFSVVCMLGLLGLAYRSFHSFVVVYVLKTWGVLRFS